MVSLIFLIAAVVLFVLAAVGVPSPPKFNFIAAGLACFALSSLLVRRYPLVSLTSLAPLDPQPDPAPDPIAIPQQWRMDKKHGMVFVVGMAPYIYMLAPVGSTPPPANVFMVGGRPGFILSFVGGYDPLPADLEMALWMVFDSVWGATPGWGADAGTQGGGVVKGFGIDGMRLDYDNTTGSGSVGSGKVDAWGVLPANAVGILDSYRAESAALGG